MHLDPLRNPVLALFRRILANNAAMWKAWAMHSNDRENPDKLDAYVRILRRAHRLQQSLNQYLP
jgi:hypothetical protein